jgi:hypothetical protein
MIGYVSYEVVAGYQLAMIDSDLKYLHTAQTWCSTFNRKIYPYDLKKIGCILHRKLNHE